MQMTKTIAKTILVISVLFGLISPCWSRPDASPKYSVIREENPQAGKERLIIPYAFPSESMGTTFGLGGMVKGYHQKQLLFGGSVFGSVDDAKGFVAGMWDYRLPWTDRFYFTLLGSMAHYPKLKFF